MKDFNTRIFILSDKMEYYIQKLDQMMMLGNPLVVINNNLYIYDKIARVYHVHKPGDTLKLISREEIMDRLESHIMMITRKRKIDKIKLRLNNG